MALAICNSTTDIHHRELNKHGSTAFPIACYRDDLAVDLVPWHWHEEWELVLVTQGRAVVLLENAQVALDVGDGLFVNSGVLHAVDSQQSKGAVLHSAVFHPRLIGGGMDSVYWKELVQPLAGEQAPRSVVLRRDTSWQEQLLADFHGAWDAVARETEDYENLTRYLLSRVARTLVCHCAGAGAQLSEKNRVDAERIRTMLAYIEAHYAQELSTAQIAQQVNVSESVCLRCFRRMLGTTPIQYVKQLRLEKAAQLLKSAPVTAREAAMRCGFHDVSYFTKAFRETMGTTPGEYQARLRQGTENM